MAYDPANELRLAVRMPDAKPGSVSLPSEWMLAKSSKRKRRPPRGSVFIRW